jgi:hypothetical protein
VISGKCGGVGVVGEGLGAVVVQCKGDVVVHGGWCGRGA